MDIYECWYLIYECMSTLNSVYTYAFGWLLILVGPKYWLRTQSVLWGNNLIRIGKGKRKTEKPIFNQVDPIFKWTRTNLIILLWSKVHLIESEMVEVFPCPKSVQQWHGQVFVVLSLFPACMLINTKRLYHNGIMSED